MKFPDAEQARRLAWLAVGLFLLGLGISATLRNQGDFATYYRTGQRVLAGLPIYQPQDKDHFLYAPAFAIAFAPFGLLPRRLAQLAFFILNAGGLIAFVIGTGVMLFGRERRLSALLIAGPVFLAFIFISNNIDHGQINLIVLALCVWSIINAREGRSIGAGAMLATAGLIKPFAILVALYLGMRRRFGALGWTVVFGMLLMFAPVIVFGAHGLLDQTNAYAESVRSMSDRYRTMITNQSAVAMFERFRSAYGASAGSDDQLPLIEGMILMVIELAVPLRLAMIDRLDEMVASRASLPALFCVIPAFAPISWKSYFAALLVPYMYLLAWFFEEPPRKPFARRMVGALFVTSILLNYVPGHRLGHLALFYSATFFSSFLLLAAVLEALFAERAG